jgi:RNA polymerase sigma-70 factor (ECF subfamily)
VEAVEDPVLEAAPDPAPGPEADAGLAAAGERLRRAVLALPDELRYAVTAHYWAERPVREIAAEQGITAVGVRKRLQRATARLALALEDPS